MTDGPDVERDWNERVEDDDVGEEGHDADDGRSSGGPRLSLLAISASRAARNEILPRQNVLKAEPVRVFPQSGTDRAQQAEAQQKYEYLQHTVGKL